MLWVSFAHSLYVSQIASYAHANIDSLACNKGTVTIIASSNQLIVIDPGVIGRRLSAPSWCEYTLMPHLVKKYGTTVIDQLIILQPNKIIFDALVCTPRKNHYQKYLSNHVGRQAAVLLVAPLCSTARYLQKRKIVN